MDLAKEFYEIRRVGTPWALILTPDYRAAVKTMAGVQTKNKSDSKRALWLDACRGGPYQKQTQVTRDGRETHLED